jgi:hypothetical protein
MFIKYLGRENKILYGKKKKKIQFKEVILGGKRFA